MGEFHATSRTRPPDEETQLATILSNAVFSVLDALAAMHHHQPGPWLDEIEQDLIREAVGSSTTNDGVYTYNNKENCEELVRYSLAQGPIRDEAFELALAAWRGLGCRDAGRVDVRADAAGRLNFIEVNVLPGLHPEHSDLPILSTMAGLSYRDLISRILASAISRLPAQVREPKPAARTLAR